MKLLHAVELPILLISIFKYNSQHFDKRLSSTLYLVGFQCVSSIVATLLSPLAGYGYDHYGFAPYVYGDGMYGSRYYVTFCCVVTC